MGADSCRTWYHVPLTSSYAARQYTMHIKILQFFLFVAQQHHYPILLMSFSSPGNANDAGLALDAETEPTSAGEEEEAPDNIETGSAVFDTLGVPTTIKHSRVTGTKKQSAYWQFYRVLKIPLQLNKRKDRNSSLLQTSTHLCILCLKCLMGKAGDISATAWKTTACRVLTSANAHHHVMKMHGDHPDVSVLLEKKLNYLTRHLRTYRPHNHRWALVVECIHKNVLLISGFKRRGSQRARRARPSPASPFRARRAHRSAH